jgi:uncharacterized membrane protein
MEKHSRKSVRKARKEAAQGNTWLGLSAITRLAICLVIGIIVAALAGYYGSWAYVPLVLWDVTAGILVASLLLSLRTLDAKQTEAHAMVEDPGRGLTDVVLILASVASLVAVVILIIVSKNETGALQYISIGLGIVSIVISWAVVHSISMVRYADLYFRTKKGIDFNSNEDPTYADFAYLAFTIGMTYQVSDTTINSPQIRRAILSHALLSYVFGTAIIAATINFVVSLA